MLLPVWVVLLSVSLGLSQEYGKSTDLGRSVATLKSSLGSKICYGCKTIESDWTQWDLKIWSDKRTQEFSSVVGNSIKKSAACKVLWDLLPTACWQLPEVDQRAFGIQMNTGRLPKPEATWNHNSSSLQAAFSNGSTLCLLRVHFFLFGTAIKLKKNTKK